MWGIVGNYVEECFMGKIYWNGLIKDSLVFLLLERVLKYYKNLLIKVV